MGQRVNLNRHGTTLSASWEAVMSHAGEINIAFTKMASLASSLRRPCGDRRRRGGGAVGGGVIPTMFLEPEEAPQPWQMPWLSSRGWTPLFVGEEEAVATMMAAMSSRWRHARASSG